MELGKSKLGRGGGEERGGFTIFPTLKMNPVNFILVVEFYWDHYVDDRRRLFKFFGTLMECKRLSDHLKKSCQC